YGYKIGHRRIATFRKIQTKTKSEFGNRRSNLCYAVDADGVVTTYGKEDSFVETFQEMGLKERAKPMDSWGEIHEFFRRKHLRSGCNAKEERDKIQAFTRWYLRRRKVHAEL
ncbi:hypothetical protein BDW02DRAFT_482452, partial [Decorospora gaudefroyi]